MLECAVTREKIKKGFENLYAVTFQTNQNIFKTEQDELTDFSKLKQIPSVADIVGYDKSKLKATGQHSVYGFYTYEKADLIKMEEICTMILNEVDEIQRLATLVNALELKYE